MFSNDPSGSSVSKIVLSKKTLRVIVFLMVFFIGAGGVYYLAKTNPELLGLSAGKAQTENEVDSLILEVGGLIVLPEGERPTVATVTDVDKVKDQPFFKNAQTGDKVLVYSQGKKAYLYRPSENKLVEVGSVNISQKDSQSSLSGTPTPSKAATQVSSGPEASATPIPASNP